MNPPPSEEERAGEDAGDEEFEGIFMGFLSVQMGKGQPTDEDELAPMLLFSYWRGGLPGRRCAPDPRRDAPATPGFARNRR
jgi:hypothetical protein